MSKLRKFYREAADEHFKPNMVNNPEDDEAMIEICKKVMRDNGIPYTEENEDDWLEFVYRANELCELQEKGYYYHRVKDDSKPSGWDYVAEILPPYVPPEKPT